MRRTLIAITALVFVLLTASQSYCLQVGIRSGDPDTNWFIYEGNQHGETVNGYALVVSSELSPKHVLVYPHSVTWATNSDFTVKQYSEEKDDLGLWIEMSEYNGTINPGETISLPFTIRIPENTEVGGHAAAFCVQEVSDSCQSGMCLLTRNCTRVYLTVEGGAAHRLTDNNYTWNGYRTEFIDIDDDGDLDKFEGSKFYENNGDRHSAVFDLITETYAGMNERKIAFADIDSDFLPEMFVPQWEHQIRFYDNIGVLGNPQWLLITDNFVNLGTDYIEDISFFDIDFDNDLDLLITTVWGKIFFYRNEGSIYEPTYTLVSSDYFADYTDYALYDIYPFPLRKPKKITFLDPGLDGVKEMIIV